MTSRADHDTRHDILVLHPKYADDLYLLDEMCFGKGHAWSEETWEKTMGYLCLQEDLVAGAIGTIMIPMGKQHGVLLILKVMVLPDCRRQGVATALINRVKTKALRGRIDWVTANVPEGALGAQLLFRSCGFEAKLPPKTLGDMVYYFFRWRVHGDDGE